MDRRPLRGPLPGRRPAAPRRPDLSRRGHALSGATDGIGLETAQTLRRRGACLSVHGRNPDRVANTVQALGGAPYATGHLADLADLDAVRALIAELQARGEPIDALVLNAGIFAKTLTRTADGREASLAVNHDANVLLVEGLVPLVAASRLRRIVVLSSVAHTRGRLDLDDLDWRRRPYDGYGAYAASKLANVLFAVALAKRLAPLGIDVNAVHPGVVSTKLLRTGFSMDGPDSVADGARTSVYLALDAAPGTTGRYFTAGRVRAADAGWAPVEPPVNPIARDASAVQAFWAESRRRVGLPA